MTVLKKEDIFKEFGKGNKDTGSSESQIALFTKRIESLSNHLKSNAKDFNTEKSLVKMVGKRRNLLEYLKKIDIQRYRDIIKKLSIRK
jgi:small subunit ribosomal protein S15